MNAISSPRSWRIRWISVLLSRPYTIAALLLCGSLLTPFMTLKRDWEECTLVEAARLWEGQSIYGHDDLYPYPPLPAFLALPFAYLPARFGQVVFYALNMTCLFLMVRWAWLLSGGGPLQGSRAAPRRDHLIMILGLMCGFTFGLNCLAHHQLDLFLGAAMIGGCLALARGRTYLAALGFGIAAALKGPALLFGPYLVWRGRWKEAMCVGAIFVALNLLPTLLVPAQFQRLWRTGNGGSGQSSTHAPGSPILLAEWVSRFVLPMGQARDYPHFWYTESNQSLLGAGYRWFCTTWEWTDRFHQQLPVAHPASSAQLKGFFLTCAALLIGGTLVVQGRWKLPGSGSEMRTALECGMVLMLMLLLSPMTSKAHCGVMLVPAFALARSALDNRSRVLAAILVVVLLAVLGSQNMMSARVVCITMWHGTVTWAILLMLIGSGFALCVENCHCRLKAVDLQD
jgi:hypothetical protein